MDEVNEFSIEEGLHQAIILKFSYGKPVLHELRKVLPKQLDIKGHCNIGQLEFRHLLIRFDLYEDFVQGLSRNSGYIKFNGEDFLFRTFLWTIWFNPKEETSKALTWISFSDLPPNLFAKKSLLSIASAVGKPVAVEKDTQERTRPSTARVKVGAKNQNDATDKGRDSRNNLVVVKDATVDREVTNSSIEATIFNSNNEDNLENKGKSIKAARRGVGKDGVLSSPNVVASKQDNSIAGNSNNEWTLVSHKKKQERIYGTDELSTEFGSTLGKSQPATGVLQHTQNSTQFDKDVNNSDLVPRDLNKNRVHVDQQVVLTYENEFIVTEGIAGK
ncbi:hypothetical protein MTR67_030318 [Solanum verrucosum]|uniref:DUF4283 domain-containing protein n=1 Tax=Solanum verrucosum TaxID=315347 RepID=A0AAF0RAA4_SOLVR|nr:hypothetical protein MTR67_030318 [Solanum verrucosum]